MAANDPLTKVIACQFDIDPDLFEIDFDGFGNLAWTDKAGFSSMIFGFILAVIASMLVILTPLQLILDADIPGLLDFIATITTDIAGFFTEVFNLKIVKSFSDSLNVYIPPFPLSFFGIDLTIPAMRPDLQAEYLDLQWLGMILGIILILINLMLLIIHVVIEAILWLIKKLGLPPMGKHLFQKVWDSLIPAMGFVIATSEYDAVSNLGRCLMGVIDEIVPAPLQGGADKPAPTEVSPLTVEYSLDAANFPSDYQTDPNPPSVTFLPLTDTIILPFTDFTASPTKIVLRIRSSEEVDIEGSVTSGDGDAISYNIPIQTLLTYDAQDIIATQILAEIDLTFVQPDPNQVQLKSISAIIQWQTSPTVADVLSFEVLNAKDTLIDSIKAKFATFGGVWHETSNIFAIRNLLGPEIAVSNKFDDIICVAYRPDVNSAWKFIAGRGTTLTSPDHYKTAEKKRGGKWNIAPGYASVSWRKGIHPNWNGRNKWYAHAAMVTAWDGDGRNTNFNLFQDRNRSGDPNKNTKKVSSTDSVRQVRSVTGKSQSVAKMCAGINFHTTGPNTSSEPATINGWSAGCQVVQHAGTYQEMLGKLLGEYGKTRIAPKQTYYSYMLFTRTQVENDLWVYLSNNLSNKSGGLVEIDGLSIIA